MSVEEAPARRLRRPPPETYVVSARVTAPMYEAIMRVLDTGAYLRPSDYLRDVVRRDLEARGIGLEPGAEKEPA